MHIENFISDLLIIFIVCYFQNPHLLNGQKALIDSHLCEYLRSKVKCEDNHGYKEMEMFEGEARQRKWMLPRESSI